MQCNRLVQVEKCSLEWEVVSDPSRSLDDDIGLLTIFPYYHELFVCRSKNNSLLNSTDRLELHAGWERA